jgi:hypothetical protein
VSWTGPKDLKAQLMRLWERGELLRDVVTGNARFPLRLMLKVPSSADITDRFNLVRAWAAELSAATALHLEWRDVRHRVQGVQRLPAGAWVNSVEDALTWLGKRREWDRFTTLVSETRQTHPALLPWLEKRSLQALELGDDWPRLLAVAGWLTDHPRPGIYLRQVDLPGVHTKFIEAHRNVLAELLDLALPPDAVDAMKAGINQFSGRYGFLDKPTRIRLRVLDARIGMVSGTVFPDVALDADSFAKLDVPVRRVFITENETNFLAFPTAPETIVIFGAGYGWDALSRADWLRHCSIHYWGDIDTHGFAILDQLRRQLPHVASFLIDRSTLMTHQALWGMEPNQVIHDLPSLRGAEQALYDDLRDNRIRSNLRLEQEMIGFGCVGATLASLVGSSY